MDSSHTTTCTSQIPQKIETFLQEKYTMRWKNCLSLLIHDRTLTSIMEAIKSSVKKGFLIYSVSTAPPSQKFLVVLSTCTFLLNLKPVLIRKPSKGYEEVQYGTTRHHQNDIWSSNGGSISLAKYLKNFMQNYGFPASRKTIIRQVNYK